MTSSANYNNKDTSTPDTFLLARAGSPIFAIVFVAWPVSGHHPGGEPAVTLEPGVECVDVSCPLLLA